MKRFRGLFLSCLLLLASLFLLPTYLFAQVIWGPDVRLTDYLRGTAYGPKIVVSGDTIHVVWYEDWVDTGNIEYIEVMYKRSTNRGLNWTADTILSPLPLGASFMPDIAVSGSVVHVAWDEEVGDSVLYTRSSDGGRNWTTPITMTQSGANAVIGVSGDTVYVEWGRVYRLSYDGGVTWTVENQIPRPARFGDRKVQMKSPFIQLAPQGYPTDTSVIIEVFHQFSSDCGQTWSQPVILSERDKWASQEPSIAANADSNVYVTWFDFKNSPYLYTGSVFTRLGSNNGNIWDTIQNITTLYRAKRPDIAVYGDNVHVVWQDDRDAPNPNGLDGFEIYYRYSSDKGNTWGPETRLTKDTMNSRGPRLAVNDVGVYLVWTDNRNPGRGYEVYFKRGAYARISTEDMRFLFCSDFRVFPNPSQGKVRCCFAFLKPEEWSFDVFDILGRRVRHYRGFSASGEVIWDTKDEQGKEVRNGVYIIRFKALNTAYQQKVIIFKGGLE